MTINQFMLFCTYVSVNCLILYIAWETLVKIKRMKKQEKIEKEILEFIEEQKNLQKNE